jgi:hypothetical protein
MTTVAQVVEEQPAQMEMVLKVELMEPVIMEVAAGAALMAAALARALE